MFTPARTRNAASVQDALGNLTIGEGYVLRDDGVAVALIDVTPPDLRLHDAASLDLLLDGFTQVLRTCPDRCSLLTFAVPLDIAPLVQTLGVSQQRAPDFQSYAILGALTDWLRHAWVSMVHLRTVRWIIAVPSVEPELPPSGTWGELLPTTIVGRVVPLSGDPPAESLTRARRLLGQFAGLGLEPTPTLLSAAAIRLLLRATLDPVAAEGAQRVDQLPAPRPLQVAQSEPAHVRA